jgi:DNA-binding transcriptional ArsR family regulator
MAAPHALAALAALGQPSRLEIFRLLVREEPTGLSAGALAEAVGCPHNTLSTHIAILARVGLVKGTREGRTITYRADAVGMTALIAFLVTDCCDGRPELCGLTKFEFSVQSGSPQGGLPLTSHEWEKVLSAGCVVGPADAAAGRDRDHPRQGGRNLARKGCNRFLR